MLQINNGEVPCQDNFWLSPDIRWVNGSCYIIKQGFPLHHENVSDLHQWHIHTGTQSGAWEKNYEIMCQ